MDKAVSLIKELSSTKNEILPKYNTTLVNEIINEMNVLFKENQDEITKMDCNSNEVYVAVKLRHLGILWRKRCLIAYHLERLKIIKDMRWELSANLPPEIAENLSPAELSWYEKYCNNLENYMSKLNDGKGLDLMIYKQAPKRNLVQIRCLIDHGEFELGDGTSVFLSKDNIYYLPRAHCEKIIQMGIVEEIIP